MSENKVMNGQIQIADEVIGVIAVTAALEVEGVVDGLDPNEKILLVCNKGKRAYLLQNRLKYFGYRNTRVLEGGITFNRVEA